MTVSFFALALVVASSVAWSGLDLLRKVLVAKIAPLPLLFYVTAGMVPLFTVWTVLDGRWQVAPGYLVPALASIALNIAANLAFFEAVKVSPLSLTIPFLSFTPVFATLLAIPLLGEVPGVMQGVGILLVVAGALLLHGDGGRLGPAALWQAFRRERGSVLMLLVALLWAATIGLDKLAVEHAGEPLHALVLSLGIGLVTLVMLAVRGRLRELAQARRAPVALVGALLIGAFALGVQLMALKLVLVSLVETLKRGIGNTLAVIFGRAVFAEPITGPKVAAVLLMAVGVAVVLLG